MQDIYSYTDFRKYLADYFDNEKRKNPNFSHRWLAQKLGLSTPNLIMLVMQGKRNLTQTILHRLCAIFKLTRRQASYFESMVHFAQAKTTDEKNLHWGRMIGVKRKMKVERIEEDQYEYYSNWYNAVIRELVTHDSFDGDIKKLARRLSPAIRPDQAARAVALLEKLGFIKRNGARFAQSNPVITTGPEVNSLGVVNFHRKMAHLAAESYERHNRNERTITGCTLNISSEGFEQIKREAADFRRRVLEIAESNESADRVYQLNIHFFPVSR